MTALKMRVIVTACLLILTSVGLTESAYAGWHQGKIQAIVFRYDGNGVAFKLQGVVPTGCGCPATGAVTYAWI